MPADETPRYLVEIHETPGHAIYTRHTEIVQPAGWLVVFWPDQYFCAGLSLVKGE